MLSLPEKPISAACKREPRERATNTPVNEPFEVPPLVEFRHAQDLLDAWYFPALFPLAFWLLIVPIVAVLGALIGLLVYWLSVMPSIG